ncbi:MAG: hypothetical protein JNJ56_14655 [Ignavibacteria bacterium]|nr:hypothetical protein [Ignavibacteria bacterium]
MNELIASTLLVLVKEMREAQNNYFKTRSKDDLVSAKYLENKVDSFIRSVTGKQVLKAKEETE